MNLKPICLVLISTLIAADAAAGDGDTNWDYQFQYRAEHVDQDSFNEDALASTLRVRINRFSLIRHNFSAELGSGDYGNEWDTSWQAKSTSHIATELKFTRYSADDFSDDTTKVWLTVSVNF